MTTPSKNPSDQTTHAGMLRAVFKKMMQRTEGQLPAVVVSYNRATNRARVRPLIAVLTTGGETIGRADIASVPVLSLGGGGYTLNFPLKKGDLGWIEASDRDISLFLQSMGESAPNTARLHSFEDCRFIPDSFAKYVTSSEDTTAVVLQTLDGTTRIALDSTGSVFRVRATTMDVVANVTIEGDVDITGNFSFSGEGTGSGNNPVNFPQGALINNKLFAAHVHSNGNDGNDTGIPK